MEVRQLQSILKEYIQKNGTRRQRESFQEDIDFSIFHNANRLIDFCKKEYDIELNDIGISYEDIQKLDFSDNEFSIDDETLEYLDETEKENLEATQDLMNSFMQNEKFVKAIDTSKDNVIDKEEIDAFFDTIKNYDLDKTTISFGDILKAGRAILSNRFKIYDFDFEAWRKKLPPIELSFAKNGRIYGTSPSGNVISTGKPIRNIESVAFEIESESSTLEGKKVELSDVIDGSDSRIVELKEQEDKLNSMYKSEVKKIDVDLANRINNKDKEINNAKKDLSNMNSKIATQKSNIRNAEVDLRNLSSIRENLENSLSTLEAALNEKGANKDRIMAKIQNVKAQINQMKQNENRAQGELESARKTLNAYVKNKTNIEKRLNNLEKQKSELDAEAKIRYPQVENYLKQYEEAKENTVKFQNDLIETLEKEIKAQEEKLNKLKQEQTEMINKKNTRMYSPTSDGQEIADFALQFVGDNERNGSADKFMEAHGLTSSTPWCAGFAEYVYYNTSADNLADWYTDCSNRLYCPTLLESATRANAVVSPNDVQPGDMILFGQAHVGIVQSVENGRISTIEGNAGDAVQNYQQAYDLYDPDLTFCRVTT